MGSGRGVSEHGGVLPVRKAWQAAPESAHDQSPVVGVAPVKAQREAAEVLRKQQEAEAAKVDEQRPIAKPDAPTVVSVIEPANDGGQMIKLGEINAALGITVTADFLDRLGIKVIIEKNAKFYFDFNSICLAICSHIESVRRLRFEDRKAA